MYSLPTEPGSIGHTLDAGFKLYFVSFKRAVVLSVLASLSLAVPMLAVVLVMPMFAGETQAPGNGFIAALVIGFLFAMGFYMWFYLAVLVCYDPTTWLSELCIHRDYITISITELSPFAL